MDLDLDLDLKIVDLDLHLDLAVAGLVTSLVQYLELNPFSGKFYFAAHCMTPVTCSELLPYKCITVLCHLTVVPLGTKYPPTFVSFSVQ